MKRMILYFLFAIALTSFGKEAFAQSYVKVPVFFGTDREPTQTGYLNSRRTDAGVIDYGRCIVTLPVGGESKQLLTPILQSRLGITSAISQAPISIEHFASKEFQTKLQNASGPKLLFIHGYATPFEKAALTAARLSLTAKVPVILYSWPSHGDSRPKPDAPFLAKTGCFACLSYHQDTENAHWTAHHFANFLQLVTDASGPHNLILVAHSMGNQVLFSGLRERFDFYKRDNQIVYSKRTQGGFQNQIAAIAKTTPSLKPEDKQVLQIWAKKIDQLSWVPAYPCVVFASPDLDRELFQEFIPEMLINSRRICVFMNEQDLAIGLSKDVNDDLRLGSSLIPQQEMSIGHMEFYDFSKVPEDPANPLKPLEGMNHTPPWEAVCDVALERTPTHFIFKQPNKEIPYSVIERK